MTMRRATAFVGVIALVLAACGGSGDGADDGGAGGATAATIGASEFAFDPADSTIAADTDVRVTLHNSGAIDHEWVVLKQGTTIDAEADFDESMVAVRIGSIGAGAEATGTVNLPAGDYQVICALIGHFDAGMKGTLEVGG